MNLLNALVTWTDFDDPNLSLVLDKLDSGTYTIYLYNQALNKLSDEQNHGTDYLAAVNDFLARADKNALQS